MRKTLLMSSLMSAMCRATSSRWESTAGWMYGWVGIVCHPLLSFRPYVGCRIVFELPPEPRSIRPASADGLSTTCLLERRIFLNDAAPPKIYTDAPLRDASFDRVETLIDEDTFRALTRASVTIGCDASRS